LAACDPAKGCHCALYWASTSECALKWTPCNSAMLNFVEAEEGAVAVQPCVSYPITVQPKPSSAPSSLPLASYIMLPTKALSCKLSCNEHNLVGDIVWIVQRCNQDASLILCTVNYMHRCPDQQRTDHASTSDREHCL
jgi:hypothetical protein